MEDDGKLPVSKSRDISNIKNKTRRLELYRQLKREQIKAKSQAKKTKKKLIKELGKKKHSLLIYS